MAELPEDVRTFIVQAHACHRRPSLIVKDVRDEFGVHLSRYAVQYYHPGRNGGKRLAEKWRHLFEATRRAFAERRAGIGIAHPAYRLMLYQRAADFYEERGNYVLAAEMAVKAAREAGDAYTDRRALTAEAGKPLIPGDIAEAVATVYAGGRGQT